jgi:CheY-like chemotaxis protein
LLEQLGSELKQHGAKCFPARDATTASWGARETLPDALVCGLELPGIDPVALLAELRSASELGDLAAVGLLDPQEPPPASSTLDAVVESGFHKCLTKPVKLPDLVDALCCVLGERPPPGSDLVPSPELIDALVVRHDYRQLLATLNATTAHRYSAFFRRDGAELHSVWTFDRERPEGDPFTRRVALDKTPCATLFATQCSHAVTDATQDPSVPEPGHALMRSFVGTPLVGLDSVIFGALCHFSPEPRPHDQPALEHLERVAKLLVHGERRRRPR